MGVGIPLWELRCWTSGLQGALNPVRLFFFLSWFGVCVDQRREGCRSMSHEYLLLL